MNGRVPLTVPPRELPVGARQRGGEENMARESFRPIGRVKRVVPIQTCDLSGSKAINQGWYRGFSPPLLIWGPGFFVSVQKEDEPFGKPEEVLHYNTHLLSQR